MFSHFSSIINYVKLLKMFAHFSSIINYVKLLKMLAHFSSIINYVKLLKMLAHLSSIINYVKLLKMFAHCSSIINYVKLLKMFTFKKSKTKIKWPSQSLGTYYDNHIQTKLRQNKHYILFVLHTIIPKREGGYGFFSESKYFFSQRSRNFFSRQDVILFFSTKTIIFKAQSANRIFFLQISETEICFQAILQTELFSPKNHSPLPPSS